MNNNIQSQLDILQDGIRVAAPLVADFFSIDTPLAEYTQQVNAYTAHPLHRERQKMLKSVVRKELARVFTSEEIEAGNIDWDVDWKINIVDHHGFLNHPILLSTNIIANMYQLPSDRPKGIVVLSDSGVPFNNAFHKRGLKFAGNQLNIFPHSQRHVMAYPAPLITEFPLLKAAQKYSFSQQQLAFLNDIQTQLQSTATHPLCTSYKDQVQRVNYQWWKQLFQEDIRSQVPDIFYVANEDVAKGLLNEYLTDTTHLFYRILCDEPTRNIVMREFMDVTGCWDTDGNRGTAFFWAIDDKQRKVPLKLEGNTLISTDATFPFTVELQPDAILAALNQVKIYPNMFLVYGMANFYCGVRPLVGFGSMNYQTKMKEAWIRALQEIEPTEVELVERVSTTGFIGGPKVTYGWDAERGYWDMYALDILFQGGYSKEYLEQLRTVPLNAVLQPSFIDMYDIYVHPDNKKEITVTSNDLMGDTFEWLKNMQV